MITNWTKSNYKKPKPGFTLIELLIVIAMMGVLVASTAIPSFNYYHAWRAEHNRNLIVSSLYETKARARAAMNDSSWSMRITSSQIIIFAGTNFATRNTALDKTLAFQGGGSPSGDTEIQFAKIGGLPDAVTTMSMSFNNQFVSVVINVLGTIDI